MRNDAHQNNPFQIEELESNQDISLRSDPNPDQMIKEEPALTLSPYYQYFLDAQKSQDAQDVQEAQDANLPVNQPELSEDELKLKVLQFQ